MRRFSNFTNEVQISPLLERDSHTHDHINLFCLWVDTTSLGIIITHDDGPLPITKANCAIPIVMHDGCKVCESIYGHGVCYIECYTPKSNIRVMQGENHIIENNYWCSYSMLRLLVE